MMMGVTEKQANLLRYIKGYQAAHGHSPCYREMAEGIGVTSKGAVARLLDGLEERGSIRRLPNRERAIQILVRVAIPRAPDGAALRAVPNGGAR